MHSSFARIIVAGGNLLRTWKSRASRHLCGGDALARIMAAGTHLCGVRRTARGKRCARLKRNLCGSSVRFALASLYRDVAENIALGEESIARS